MGLTEDFFDIDDSLPEEPNRYLRDEEAGIELVGKIVSRSDKENAASVHVDLRRLINEKLIGCVSALRLQDEFSFTRRLEAVSERLIVPEKYRLLRNLTVIGVAGQFSSGKSAFLNSLLGESQIQLPEEQTPSTAVPSYIINGQSEKAYAYNIHGSRVALDSDAMGAVSHAFNNKFGLGLAQYLSFLTLTSPAVPKGIAFLDTPGYNKADHAVLETYTDREKTREELQSIDFLIWLMDVSNGTLTKADIEFIQNTEVETPILIVVNKCDMKREEEVNNVIAEVRRAAENSFENLFDVVAYSAQLPDQFVGGLNRISHFIKSAQNSEIRVENLDEKLVSIRNDIMEQAREAESVLAERKESLGDIIAASNDPLAMKGVAEEYTRTNREISQLSQRADKVKDTVRRVRLAMARL